MWKKGTKGKDKASPSVNKDGKAKETELFTTNKVVNGKTKDYAVSKNGQKAKPKEKMPAKTGWKISKEEFEGGLGKEKTPVVVTVVKAATVATGTSRRLFWTENAGYVRLPRELEPRAVTNSADRYYLGIYAQDDKRNSCNRWRTKRLHSQRFPSVQELSAHWTDLPNPPIVKTYWRMEAAEVWSQ